MYLEKAENNIYKIKLSPQEIGRCAKILAELQLLDESLDNAKKRLNDLIAELANLTQMFLH
jgi:hypothetical protein